MRAKTPKRRVRAKLRDDRKEATQPNETWAMDFVHDQLAMGDNGTELTSNAILSWSAERHVEWHYIMPGKPMQNVSGVFRPRA